MSPYLEMASDCLLGILTGAFLVLIGLLVNLYDNLFDKSGIDYE